MSTGSATSDVEDYDASHRTHADTACYNTGRSSDEDVDNDSVDVRFKQERRGSRAQQKDARQTQRNAANARERARMRVLSKAFSRLKTSLPWVPADTKLSKLDTLRLASSYICHLRQLLQDERFESSFAHPVNLVWPSDLQGLFFSIVSMLTFTTHQHHQNYFFSSFDVSAVCFHSYGFSS